MKTFKFARILFLSTSLIILIVGIIISKSNFMVSVIAVLAIVLLVILDIQAPKIANLSGNNPKVKTMRFINRLTIVIIIMCIVFSIYTPIEKLFSIKTNEVIYAGLVSMFIMTVGNLSPIIPFNRYLGLRLPWTISDEDTWKVAHKILGYLSFPIAVAMFILTFYFSLNTIIPVCIIIWIIIPSLYSLLFYYKKIKGLKMGEYKVKLNKKDILILVIPVIIIILIIPVLPNKIPMQWNFKGNVNWYLDKNFSFIIGVIPFIIYKSYMIKHGYK